jgi:predicted RNA-binding Zn-ribbon protein involved in translation (DUF1610 family)
VNTHFLDVVQSAMRAIAACPACGRRITREEGVRLRGERYHRSCAYYSAARGESKDGR